MNETIFRATIEEFNENGIRFTMDDLAKRMRVSKRTIYENIISKEAVISDIIDSYFADIKQQESEILNNSKLTIIEKIYKVICILPRIPFSVDYNRIYEIQKYYPDLYKKIDNHLTGEWEVTLSLFKQGINEGLIRDLNISIVRQMLLGTMRVLLDQGSLAYDQVTYGDALEQALDIVMNGILL